MAKDTTEEITQLVLRSHELERALVGYQRALITARGAGIPYGQIAETLGMSESGVRWRCATAQNGGEIHLQLEPLKEQGADNEGS